MSRSTVTATLFVSLLLFWLALSGRFDPLFLAVGVASAVLVTWLTRDVVATVLTRRPGRSRPVYRTWRAAVYVAWLIGRIFVASAQVAYYVLHPAVPLRPAVMRFRTTLESPVARTVLANSITLVPGTMTLRLDEGEYVVHALVPGSAGDLVAGTMQTMIAKVFLEEPQPAPDVSWERGASP